MASLTEVIRVDTSAALATSNGNEKSTQRHTQRHTQRRRRRSLTERPRVLPQELAFFQSCFLTEIHCDDITDLDPHKRARHPKHQASRLVADGYFALQEGNNQACIDRLEQAIDVLRGDADRNVALIGILRHYVGIACRRAGDMEREERQQNLALECGMKSRDRLVAGRALKNLGLFYLSQGFIDKAETATLKALALAQSAGDQDLQSRCFANLGHIACSRRDFALALEYHRQDLMLSKEKQTRVGILRSHQNLIVVYENSGEHQTADSIRSAISGLSMQEAAMHDLATLCNAPAGNIFCQLERPDLHMARLLARYLVRKIQRV